MELTKADFKTIFSFKASLENNRTVSLYQEQLSLNNCPSVRANFESQPR